MSAVGILNNPTYPEWPGLTEFEGATFHSARWDGSIDLKGKRVAVVGTGSTAAQIVPAIAHKVEKLYLYQRQPGWVLPKGARSFGMRERAQLARPIGLWWLRARQLMKYEQTRTAKIAGTRANQRGQAACEAYIQSIFEDRPDIAKIVTPTYPYGGKRVVKDDNFYPALLRDNVELIPSEVQSVTAHEVIDSSGQKREVDVIIMCTGFRASDYLSGLQVIGQAGVEIHDFWAGEPKAFLGLTVPGFPNFYMLYGPNSNGGVIMFMIEQQVAFVKANLARMMARGVNSIEVRPLVFHLFNRVLEHRLSRCVVMQYPEVHNYGRTARGRNVIAWEEGMIRYAIAAKLTRRLSNRAT